MSFRPRNEWDRYAPIYLEKMESAEDHNRNQILPAMCCLCEGDLQERMALDVGCGSGHLSFFLEQQNAVVFGIDSSTILIREAKRKASLQSSKAQFIVSDASSLCFASEGKFDLIISNMSLQDMEDAEGAIQEMARVGRSGARVLCSFRHPWTDGWREHYLEEHRLEFSLQAKWQRQVDETTYPPRFHRPLSFYMNAFLRNGFEMVRCEEIADEPSPSGMPLAWVLDMVLTE